MNVKQNRASGPTVRRAERPARLPGSGHSFMPPGALAGLASSLVTYSHEQGGDTGTDMNRFLAAILLVCTAGLTASSAQAGALGLQTLNGSYAYILRLHTADPAEDQFAIMGIATCDGAGHITASFTSTTDGNVQTGTLNGTYTVNADGTGEIDYGPNPVVKLAIAVHDVSGGIAHAIEFLQTNDSLNEVQDGHALLQATTAQTFSKKSLKGTYVFHGERLISDPGGAQDAYLAVVTFDGKGKVKGTLTLVYAGDPETDKVSGTYKINSNGSASFKISDVTFAVALDNVSKNHAAGFLMLRTGGQDQGNFADTAEGEQQ